MSFLQEKCSFGLFTRQQSDECKPFHCGDDDLDEFFLRDAFLQSDELLCKNYCFTLDNPDINRRKIRRDITFDGQ